MAARVELNLQHNGDVVVVVVVVRVNSRWRARARMERISSSKIRCGYSGNSVSEVLLDSFQIPSTLQLRFFA